MRTRICLISVLLAIALAFSLSLEAKGKSGGDTGAMNVQMRSSIVRSTPNYLGASVGTLSYGQQVNVIGEQGNWYQIDKPAGWVPKGDLTSHKLAVNPDQKFAGSGGKHDEVALAGKGFNPQVEAQYKKDNPNLASAFVLVDRVEAIDVPTPLLKVFQTAGKLTPR